jgi:hypothetical protein
MYTIIPQRMNLIAVMSDVVPEARRSGKQPSEDQDLRNAQPSPGETKCHKKYTEKKSSRG